MSSFHLFRRISGYGHLSPYFHLSESVPSLQRQLIYRCSNLGMLELDLIIGSWARKRIPTLDHSELLKFNEEILSLETPEIYARVLGVKKNEAKEGFENELKNYAQNFKNN
jgi:succinate dehydrogenase flavin-adding protein (antitoxin of CptAB toxin-antitoxin module)